MKSRWPIALLVMCIAIPTFAQDQGVPNVAPLGAVKDCTVSTPKTSIALTPDTEHIYTTSKTYIDLAPLKVSFTIPGLAYTCLKVHVAAVTYAPGEGLILMRVLVDGTPIWPNEAQWSTSDHAFGEVHSANFFAFDVAPGTHTVNVQWRSAVGNTTVHAFQRSIAVDHK